MLVRNWIRRFSAVWLVLSLLLMFAGCRSIPFSPTEKMPLGDVDAEEVIRHYGETMPMNYQLVNSVVFHYYWKTFSALGWLAVDQSKDSFALTVMTPMGVKLFDLQGVGGDITCPFAMEEFTKHGDFASVVGRDIREVYLDLVPGKNAKVKRKKYVMTYRDEKADGRVVEYTLGGPERRLLRKRGYIDGELVWTIEFYEYISHNGKWYPRGIVLRHHRYYYSFEIRLKEFMD